MPSGSDETAYLYYTRSTNSGQYEGVVIFTSPVTKREEVVIQKIDMFEAIAYAAGFVKGYNRAKSNR